MLRCIGEKIIIEESEKIEYEKNGIIIKTNGILNLIGNVICVGEKVQNIKVGDRVIYSEKDTKRIIYNNKEYFVLEQDSVLAII